MESSSEATVGALKVEEREGGMVVVVVEAAAVVMVLDASARHCFRCTICNALVIQQWFSVRRSQRLRVKFAVAVQRGERCCLPG